jgi:phosphatidylethanolamine-binding protein (PEBP) family uncharacterized protein
MALEIQREPGFTGCSRMSATTTELSEGVPKTGTLPDGSRQGVNDFKRVGYGGPCPPPGKAHRYFFRV